MVLPSISQAINSPKNKRGGRSHPFSSLYITNRLGDYASYNTSTYGTATFTDSETQAVVHCDRSNQGNNHLNVVARHYHLYAFRQFDGTGHVR